MQKKVSRTNLRAAETAAPPGKITTEDRVRKKCFPLFALRAAKKPRFPLNQAAINPSIAKNVLRKDGLKPQIKTPPEVPAGFLLRARRPGAPFD